MGGGLCPPPNPPAPPTLNVLKTKITSSFVLYSNTEIFSLISIKVFLVCWLGPWSVSWLSPVRILPKSLLAYIFTEILKMCCF